MWHMDQFSAIDRLINHLVLDQQNEIFKDLVYLIHL